MPMNVDEFIAAIAQCADTDALFAVFRADIEREGFQNITVARNVGTEIFEVPYLCVPEGAPAAYFEQNLAEHDPVFRMIANRAPAFTWREMEQRDLSSVEKHVVGACRELGLSGGFTLPFYGPYGISDIVGLSFREPRGIAPERYQIVAMKSYAFWLRYQELDAAHMAGQAAISGQFSHQEISTRSPRKARRPHKDGPAAITADECRALIISDIAARRYKAGLTLLNDTLETVLGRAMFARLRERQLLLDEPDDDNWRYYFTPSPVAVAHIRRCSHVPQTRAEVWRLYVQAGERITDDR